MPDIEYRSSDAFLNLSVRNPPPKELIDEIYMNTRFDVRFYEEKQVVEGQEKGMSFFGPFSNTTPFAQ